MQKFFATDFGGLRFPKCTFCGQQPKGGYTLGTYQHHHTTFPTICSDCAGTYYKKVNKGKLTSLGIVKPKEIRAMLDMYVVGQDRAKKIISVAVYNHLKRLAYKEKKIKKLELAKSNILLVGPSGTGKTLLAQSLARFLEVPLCIAETGPLTSAGYIGEDVDSILEKLLQVAGSDIKKAQRGVVYIDEIDKVAKRGGSASHGPDVHGEGVQRGLLKILEGKKIKIRVNPREPAFGENCVELDTSNILFICGGAFESLLTFMEGGAKKTSGFSAVDDVKTEIERRAVTPDKLHKFGMLPELIGRIPVIAELEALTEDLLIKIMTEPHNAIIRQYQKLFQMSGGSLVAELNGLKAIASIAIEKKTGARALRGILEDVLLETMFALPSNPGTYILNAKAVKNKKLIKKKPVVLKQLVANG